MNSPVSRPAYRISVVIPAYNEALTIHQCLDALTKQTVSADEIIVVDNNSSDDTAKIARSYPNIRVVSETEAQGITPARNTGLDATTGDILCRIDADTIVPANWIAHIRDHFDKNPRYITSVYGLAGSADFNVPYSRWLQRIIGIAVLDIGFFIPTWLMLGGHSTLYGSNMALTRHAWKAVRSDVATDDSVHEDVDLSACIVATHGHIDAARLPRVLVSPRSLHESPRKFFWRIRIWIYSSQRIKRLSRD